MTLLGFSRMRTATQIFLTLPATLLAPIGWLVTFMGFSADVEGPAFIYFTKTALFFLGSLVGLIALWRSIFATRIKGLTRPSRLLVAGLVVGLLLDAIFVVGGLFSPPRNLDAPGVVFFAWLIGGPFVVGIWNFVALLSPHERAQTDRSAPMLQ